VRRLRDAGYKLTHARLAVLAALEESGGHLTSGQLIDAVGKIDESIGRASIFRTLDLLTSLAIIRPTYIASSMTPTYVLMPDGHHHHIICTECSRVIEFEHCQLDTLTAYLEQQFGCALTGHLLEFYGVCADCRRKLRSNS
jgi:Fur family ferric uptake transcriptional regulator